MIKKSLFLLMLLAGTQCSLVGMEENSDDADQLTIGGNFLARISTPSPYRHSDSPHVIDSPHSVTPGPRCDSPALFGIVHQLLRRPIYERDIDGNIRTNVYFDDIPKLNNFARLCNTLDNDELLGIIFTDIQPCGYSKFLQDEPFVEDVLRAIKDTAGDGKCAAVISWQNFRYIIAKNNQYWIFVNLQHQSENARFRPGSHVQIYDSLDGAIQELDTLWKNLQAVWRTIPEADPLMDNTPYLTVKYYRKAKE